MKRTFLLFVLLITVISFGFAPDTTPDIGIKKVVIDAGHGGHDPGCLGPGSKEKDVALAIALKLGEAIEKNYDDVEVIYTRKKDVFVTLENRAKIANEANADLFICVHANANGNTSAYGTETYVMGINKENANKEVAKRENDVILMEDDYETKYSDFAPGTPEYAAALDAYLRAYQKQSIEFAIKIQDQFTTVGRKNRGVKQESFLVLYRTTMPSVLIETGFLTNKEEEEFLLDPEKQKLIAGSIFKAFTEYKADVEGVTIKLEEKPPETEKSKAKEDLRVMNNAGGTTSSPQVIYRVQLASSTNQVETKSYNFKGLTDVFEYEQNGMYRYYTGNTKDLSAASEIQASARETGYKDAFVVAFYKGEKISMSKAREISK
ncbi:MAG: N-acetylmuramoyl-L-alanine amidase [Flavobacteriales bacterium]|nr:N-acetylmuramoyl-L-alanine amidase [Flavobacteriales bacterium]